MDISEQNYLIKQEEIPTGINISESGELSVFRTFYEAMEINQLTEERKKLDADIQTLREKKYNTDNVNNQREVTRNDITLESDDLHFAAIHDDLDTLMAREKIVDSLLKNAHIDK